MSGPFELIGKALTHFKEHAWKFIAIYLIAMILPFLWGVYLGIVGMTEAWNPVNIAILAVLFVALFIVLILMGIALIIAAADPTISVKTAYLESKKFFWRYIGLSLLVGLAVLGGFILLIIPGLIFMVWFGFSHYILVLEGVGGTEAMKRSKKLVSGRFWEVVGRVGAFLLVVIGASIVLGMVAAMLGDTLGNILSTVFNAVMTPVSVIYYLLLYRELKATAAPAVVPPPPMVEPATV